jgi:hypothetical protein
MASRRPRRLALAACASLVLLGSPARADNKNPNLIPLGETESFLGNAGVGRATDTGAVYYNPAGLAELDAGRVSVSGAVYLAFAEHYDSFVYLDNTNVPFDASGFVTIPSSYVATRRLGDWVGALSVLVPQSLELDGRLPFTTPNTSDNILYSATASELWIGLSLAHMIVDRLYLGVTVFGIDHSGVTTLGLDVQNSQLATAFASSIARTDYTNLSLLTTVGLSYLATDWLRFGVRAQSTNVQVYGNADAYQVTHTTPVTGAPQTQTIDVKGPANYTIPFDFSVGAAVMPADWLTVLADVSVQLGTSYTEFPDGGPTYSNYVSLDTTPRFNAGAELRPVKEVPIRVGFFYNPSAEGLDRSVDGYSKEDYLGVTAGVGINDEHVKTSIGGFYTWSNGEATNGGVTAALNSHGEGVLLTTAYSF